MEQGAYDYLAELIAAREDLSDDEKTEYLEWLTVYCENDIKE